MDIEPCIGSIQHLQYTQLHSTAVVKYFNFWYVYEHLLTHTNFVISMVHFCFLFRCQVVDNQNVLDDLLDLLNVNTLNAIVRWLSVYWYIPVAVVVGIGILIILLQITYRRKLKKPLKRRINSMRRSVRGERDRGRGVSEAQTGGVGGVDRTDAAPRRRGEPRQISQRKLLTCSCLFELLYFLVYI